ncbi:dihydroorotase [Haliea sp.]|uniref:dihydroorotase n=1 Tax=Haliea TaxID=475794 RepID=UPI000C554914|nr:dihydroorotase [Haliea sp.]HAN68020.1 dihydroorotase [Halieaceae bacterium]MAD64626.1 dihydroorotase [Haliea sp.]MAY93124.1 dihydroorotase [Haliea sp.]MBK39673.1 dihydroorotase [Haliea sp.]MBP69534.1 dihydroorotase [Haliea sp.]
MTELSLLRPDDWHVHLRDDAALTQTCADMARYFGRAIVMPNLTPPVTTVAAAAAYRERILAAMDGLERRFEPLMTLYLTDATSADEIRRAADSDFVHAVKLYPAGATTNSDAGVAELEGLYPTLEAMQDVDLPLLIHGEVTDHAVDIFDREKVFIDRHLAPIVERFPGLRVVLEHITTADAVDFVSTAPGNVAATITAHHLLLNRNDMLVGGIRPHYYCLPVLKRNTHQAALLRAATSGSPRFFLGTDSAPHATGRKETACGCAGCYTAHAALELYAEAFEAAGALDRLEAFASHFGADFYRLPRNRDRITLRKTSWAVPTQLPLADTHLTPLRAGESVAWQIGSEAAGS